MVVKKLVGLAAGQVCAAEETVAAVPVAWKSCVTAGAGR